MVPIRGMSQLFQTIVENNSSAFVGEIWQVAPGLLSCKGYERRFSNP
jgi:hypothetical protein